MIALRSDLSFKLGELAGIPLHQFSLPADTVQALEVLANSFLALRELLIFTSVGLLFLCVGRNLTLQIGHGLQLA
jgi:hypothetical protein